MHWFIDPIKNHYADFDGRVGRQEYWMFVLFSILIQIAFDIVGLDIISMLLSLVLLVPSIALSARRLHDINKSGWWQLLGFIPIVGWIILIVWWATKTDDQDNTYGKPAVPKTGPEVLVTNVVPVATSAPAEPAPSPSSTSGAAPVTDKLPEQHS